MSEKTRKLFGFRSGKPWKMVIASIYYAAVFMVACFAVTTPLPDQTSIYDKAIYLLSSLILVLWMLSPAIFLSNTKFREKLPIFRNRTGSSSLLGMMIVFLFFAYLFAAVEDLHSLAYKDLIRHYSEMMVTTTLPMGQP